MMDYITVYLPTAESENRDYPSLRGEEEEEEE